MYENVVSFFNSLCQHPDFVQINDVALQFKNEFVIIQLFILHSSSSSNNWPPVIQISCKSKECTRYPQVLLDGLERSGIRDSRAFDPVADRRCPNLPERPANTYRPSLVPDEPGKGGNGRKIAQRHAWLELWWRLHDSI